MRERLAKLLAQGGAPRNADHSECESKINVLTQRLKRITDWHNKEMAMGKTIQCVPTTLRYMVDMYACALVCTSFRRG